MSLKISSRLIEDVVILDMSGRIMLGQGSVQLRDSVRSILSEGKRKILLNLADVTYIDSSGLAELFSASMKVRSQGGEIKFLGLTKRMHELLQITKLYTFVDVYDDESKALESFESPPLRCCCPLCGEASGPPALGAPWIVWPPQACRNSRCEATFTVFSTRTQGQAKTVRIQTYKDEYCELQSGPPFIVKVVGRLDLFSSPALKKAWQAIPRPRRVLFDLSATTEIDDAGREALAEVFAKRENDARAVVVLEGLSSEQVNRFPSESYFYQNRKAALAALGNVSDTPLLQVRVLSEMSS